MAGLDYCGKYDHKSFSTDQIEQSEKKEISEEKWKPVVTCMLPFESRLKTFKDWPIQMNQNAVDMCKAGFFYTKCGDKVRCFSCGIGLKKWADTDKPLKKHKQFSPNCYFIQSIKFEL